MVRTCDTTIWLFAKHPNKHKIKFILCPIVKEGLNLNNDLSHSIEHLYSLYGEHNKEKNHGIVFDFSQVKGGVFGVPIVWNFDVLTDFDAIQSLYQNVDSNTTTHEEVNN